MFAYCLNNPVNAIDLSGKDAIWLQDVNNQTAKILGHTGLFIQNDQGSWYYFNWTNSYCVLRKVDPEAYDYESIDSMIKYDGDRYDIAIRFEGDFSESITYAQSLEDTYQKDDYNLVLNNCMQVVTDVLMKGEFAQSNNFHKLALCKARTSIVPNVAFFIMVSAKNKAHILHMLM